MTCYEILTRKLPFKRHPMNDYDLILNGQRLEVPCYVEDWTCEFFNMCWQSNPEDHPSFGDILYIFLTNSVANKMLQFCVQSNILSLLAWLGH